VRTIIVALVLLLSQPALALNMGVGGGSAGGGATGGGSSSVTIADSGDGNAATGTVDITEEVAKVTCNDTDGCDITLGESYPDEGDPLTIVNVSANDLTLSTSAGVQTLSNDITLGQNESITFSYAGSQWVESSRSSSAMWTYFITMTAEVTNSTTTLANVTGLSFSAAASTTYMFSVAGLFDSAAATTGIAVSATGPTSPTAYSLTCSILSAADTFTTFSEVAYGGNGPTATTIAQDVDYPFFCTGILVNGANAGTVQIQFKSEVGASQVAIRPGTTLKYKPMQ